MTDTIERAPAQVLTTDTTGLVGTDTQPITANVEAPVRRAIAARTERVRRFLAAVCPLPVDGRIWVPDLTPATGGGEQSGEKADFPLTDLTITGASHSPTLVGGAWNVSWQVMTAAGSTLDLLLAELALQRAVDYVIDQMTADAGTGHTTVAEAAAAVEAAGWPVDFLAGSTAALMGVNLDHAIAIGLPIYAGLPAGTGVLIGSLSGTWGAMSEVILRQAEPAIAGFEVGAFVEIMVETEAGSVAVVTA